MAKRKPEATPKLRERVVDVRWRFFEIQGGLLKDPVSQRNNGEPLFPLEFAGPTDAELWLRRQPDPGGSPALDDYSGEYVLLPVYKSRLES